MNQHFTHASACPKPSKSTKTRLKPLPRAGCRLPSRQICLGIGFRTKTGRDDGCRRKRSLPHPEKPHRPRRQPAHDANIDADAPEHTAFAPEFLMQQMEWRETLAEARAAGDTAALNALEGQVSAEQSRPIRPTGCRLRCATISNCRPTRAARPFSQ